VSLTSQLIDQIKSKPICAADRRATALFMLDAIACAYAGTNTNAGRKILRWARTQGRDAGRLAFVIAGLTHIVETDDLHRASVTHPGCIVVPTVLAMARYRRAVTTSAIVAMLHGFEAMCRIGIAVGQEHYKVWHNTATCGPFGSAMAAGSMLALDKSQMVDALGNAGTQSSGLWQFLETGAMSKHLHAARATESGLIAAELAKEGFSGPPEILEGARVFL